VRCELQAGNPPQKSCDLALTLAGQGQAASPVAQILITRPSKKEPMRLVVQLQPNVLVAPGVKLVHDDKQRALALPFSAALRLSTSNSSRRLVMRPGSSVRANQLPAKRRRFKHLVNIDLDAAKIWLMSR
jgi:hypothetical protein